MPEQALLGFHENYCRRRTGRAERRSSSGAAISRRVAMSRIIRSDGGPIRADVSLHVLPDHPGIKRARPGIQRARPGIEIQHALPGMRGPASSARGRQWPEVYDLCHTFLHVARVKNLRPCENRVRFSYVCKTFKIAMLGLRSRFSCSTRLVRAGIELWTPR